MGTGSGRMIFFLEFSKDINANAISCFFWPAASTWGQVENVEPNKIIIMAKVLVTQNKTANRILDFFFQVTFEIRIQ